MSASHRTLDISKGPKINDLIIGILTNLPHTPINASGLNHSLHMPVGREKDWHKIGNALAPKNPVWENLYEEPGMLSISVQSVRKGPTPGVTNVMVQPSSLIPNGLYVTSNFDFKTTHEVGSAYQVIEFIQNDWGRAITEAKRVAECIFEKLVWNQP